MPEGAVHPALRRVLNEAGDPALVDKLTALPGADLTTVLLEVQRRRAGRVTPAQAMRNYGRDRFVGPASVGFGAQRRAEDVMLAALPAGFEALTLATAECAPSGRTGASVSTSNPPGSAASMASSARRCAPKPTDAGPTNRSRP